MHGYGSPTEVLRSQWHLEYCYRYLDLLASCSNALGVAVDLAQERRYNEHFWIGHSVNCWWEKRNLNTFSKRITANAEILAACVRYDFVMKQSSAEEKYYLVLADSLNWCTIEAYVGKYLSAPCRTYLIYFLSDFLRLRPINFRLNQNLRSVYIRLKRCKIPNLSTIAWCELCSSTGASEK